MTYKDQQENPPAPEINQELENGPLKNRGCTDICCWIIFVAAFGFWIISLFVGITKGDPVQAFSPWDDSAQQCGYTEAVKDYSYAYFYTVIFIKKFCLKKMNSLWISAIIQMVITRQRFFA